MQIYIDCEFCGARLGGFAVSGREQTITMRPCYTCMRKTYGKALDIVEKRARKAGKAFKRD